MISRENARAYSFEAGFGARSFLGAAAEVWSRCESGKDVLRKLDHFTRQYSRFRRRALLVELRRSLREETQP